ncbi:hypothetical protein BDB01DRAFT_906346 [Pilobolus umbonatus]|nr:hypothetical protein BDB01DRAFT_906346 [Pilobolus umbonatus]
MTTCYYSSVTELAKDLEGEFYPYYPIPLSCMISLVYHQDIKLLEQIGHYVRSGGIHIQKELLAQPFKEDVSAEELPTKPVHKILLIIPSNNIILSPLTYY